MPPPSDPPSTGTLLFRLAADHSDDGAWRQFEARFGPLIEAWCHDWGMQPADAQDLKQTVLIKLLAALKTFLHDPSRDFRAFLRTVSHHAWCDYLRSRERVPTPAGSELNVILETAAFPDRMSVELEKTWEEDLVAMALARVRLRVQPKTWDAFQLTALEGLSGEAAADRLGVKIASIYKSRSNVQKMLQGEMAYLEEVHR